MRWCELYKRLLLVAIAVAMMGFGAEADTWYVYPDGSGTNPTIQSAVDSAAVSGDVIFVKAGTYHEGDIVVDGKSITIDQSDGRVFINLPSTGNGTCITIRNVTSFTLNSLVFRGFETAIAVENASPSVQFITVVSCNRGVTISGASSAPSVWFGLIDSCGTGVEIQGGSVTLQNETIVNCATGVRFLGGSTTFTRSIVYNCSAGVQCSGGSATLGCNDFFLNGSNYDGCASGTNDFYTDPKFCFWKSVAGPYQLHDTSPCFTRVNPCNVRIGAFTSPIAGCTGTAVEQSSWGAIKDIYR